MIHEFFTQFCIDKMHVFQPRAPLCCVRNITAQIKTTVMVTLIISKENVQQVFEDVKTGQQK